MGKKCNSQKNRPRLMFYKQWPRDKTYFESFVWIINIFAITLLSLQPTKKQGKDSCFKMFISPQMYSYTQKYSLSICCMSGAC